jgi:hypothetical protein
LAFFLNRIVSLTAKNSSPRRASGRAFAID